MKLENLTIEALTNEETVNNFADEIFAADNGYGNYTTEQINSILFALKLTDREGTFYDDLSGQYEKIANMIIDRIS